MGNNNTRSTIRSQIMRGASVAAIAVGSAAAVFAIGLTFSLVPKGYYTIILGYSIYIGSLSCAALGVYATGVAKAHALRLFGRTGDGRLPRWNRVVGPCPLWLRRASRIAFVAMLLYAAVIWLQTWHRRESFNVAKLAALFSAFAAALSWNSAVSLAAAANWLDGAKGDDEARG